MRSEIVKEFVAMIEADAQNRPSPAECEMAYQARVAMDRIRFAIKLPLRVCLERQALPGENFFQIVSPKFLPIKR
jgi:hypothetical protein